MLNVDLKLLGAKKHFTREIASRKVATSQPPSITLTFDEATSCQEQPSTSIYIRLSVFTYHIALTTGAYFHDAGSNQEKEAGHGQPGNFPEAQSRTGNFYHDLKGSWHREKDYWEKLLCRDYCNYLNNTHYNQEKVRRQRRGKHAGAISYLNSNQLPGNQASTNTMLHGHSISPYPGTTHPQPRVCAFNRDSN